MRELIVEGLPDVLASHYSITDRSSAPTQGVAVLILLDPAQKQDCFAAAAGPLSLQFQWPCYTIDFSDTRRVASAKADSVHVLLDKHKIGSVHIVTEGTSLEVATALVACHPGLVNTITGLLDSTLVQRLSFDSRGLSARLEWHYFDPIVQNVAGITYFVEENVREWRALARLASLGKRPDELSPPAAVPA